HVVKDDRGPTGDVTTEQLARHLPEAARLVDKRFADRPPLRPLQGLTEQLHAFLSAGVGRDDRDAPTGEPTLERMSEENMDVEMLCRAAKGVLEGGEVMRGDGDDAVDADRLEHLREIAGDHRIARLRLPLLARIAEIRRN